MLYRTNWIRLNAVRGSITGRGAKRLGRTFRPQVEPLEDRCVLSTTYLVTSLADNNIFGTLRFAINQANANHTGTAAAPDLIQITTGGGTIGVDAVNGGVLALAAVEVAVIDATTAINYNGTPLINLDGSAAGAGASGLTISGGASTVKGLAIVHFSGSGIRLDTNGQDTVQSCYIGITTAGVVAGNGRGITISDASGNTIGGPGAGAGNLISGNGGDGILITGSNSSNNLIAANDIGTDATGSVALGNGGNGILVTAGASGTIIGGSPGNVISGNGGNGVLINGGATLTSVSGNLIGLAASGNAALGNSLDGVRIQNANNNLIGHGDPVSDVTYYNDSLINQDLSIANQQVDFFEGIRNADTAGQYLISGQTALTQTPGTGYGGFLFVGSIAGVGTTYAVNYPNAATTSAYGPDNEAGGKIGLVGSYSSASTPGVQANGFLFQGTTADLTNSSNYRTIDEPGAVYNFVHSTMGGLAVGNYDSQQSPAGHAFIYSIAQSSFLTDVVFPGSQSNTAYGIWANGGTSYTICGGFGLDAVNNFANQDHPIGQAYLVDYDSATGAFSNWASFSYPFGVNFATHFEGISSVEKGVYTLVADSVQIGSTNPVQGSWATVRRNTDGSFGPAAWVNLNNPGSTTVSSANSVYGNQVVGVVLATSPTVPFQATINVGFHLSNAIGGNGGNGISLSAANGNQIAMNTIGTNRAGTAALGNAGNGILVTDGAAGNTIGGQATGGNDPVNNVFVRPPQGNLISGNSANGVLITRAATQNTLSGNFIGTAASGIAPLANSLDGVAIVSANGNSLLGCTFPQDPFVFYNVISGNGGNGVRVTNSSNTTVQANFFGIGADNTTPVGNGLDGVLINGTSANTQFGGVIPLGNVVADNSRNGVEIADTASGTVCFNTFSGLPAFKVVAAPNVLDGFLITSTGGNNLLRTNVISGNLGNGVHIAGNATGVQVAEDIIGMNSNGQEALPNGADGILIDGNANNNLIGGTQVSVILQNTISANGADGVAIVGNSSDNQVFHSFIGTDIKGLQPFGNAGAGIFIGGSAQNNTIGGVGAFDQNVISGNLGGGIQLSGTSQGTQAAGNFIGSDRNGLNALGNHGNGIWIVSSNNRIGGTAAGTGNVIAFNSQVGVLVDTGTGNAIQGNSIFGNASPGILLIGAGNLNQPAPILSAAYAPTPGTIQVTGSLTAAANTTFTVEIFASPSSAAPGQGQTFLGSLTVTTAANGFIPLTFSSSLPTSAGSAITATATDPNNNTSALSAAIVLGGNSNSSFVANVYGLLLNRAPDPASAAWVNALNGGASPTSVVLGIEGSPEYLTDQLVALYSRYLNRSPDPSGEQAWLNALLGGGTLEQVAEGLVGSPEYYQDHGSTNQGYVLGLYTQVLGRSPSTSELNSWVGALDAGESRTGVAIGFLTSAEYRTDLVETDYSLYLGRAADSSGLAGWVNALQAGSTDQTVLAGIFGSAEGFSKWS